VSALEQRTAMMFRNLASMDVEESIRGNPIDGVVLLCGCDDGYGELQRMFSRLTHRLRDR